MGSPAPLPPATGARIADYLGLRITSDCAIPRDCGLRLDHAARQVEKILFCGWRRDIRDVFFFSDRSIAFSFSGHIIFGGVFIAFTSMMSIFLTLLRPASASLNAA